MRRISVLVVICFAFLISMSQVGFASAENGVRYPQFFRHPVGFRSGFASAENGVRHPVWAGKAPEIKWVKQFGTSESDTAGRIAVDSWGNAYMTGALENNAFIAKYDPFGRQLWVKQFGTDELNIGMGIAVDRWGKNIYVTGVSGGESGEESWCHAFIAKYDCFGRQLWVKQVNVSEFEVSEFDMGAGIAVDSGENIYVTGAFFGEDAFSADAFIAKFDRSGNQLWVNQFGTGEDDIGAGIAVDSGENIYVTGAFGEDAFIAKFDRSGKFMLWSEGFGTSGIDMGTGIALDRWGKNIYVTGVLGGELWSDAFIAEWDCSGNRLWLKQFGTSEDDFGTGIAVDFWGNAYVAGSTMGTFENQTSAGGFDAFIAKFDRSGNQLWVNQFGTSGDEGTNGGVNGGVDIALDFWGNIYVSGSTNGAFPGQTSAGSDDLFIAKFGAFYGGPFRV